MNKEYELRLKIMNGLLLELMKLKGLKTAADLSNACGVNQVQVGKMLNLKTSAYNKYGEIRPAVALVADYFAVIPEMIFPEDNIYNPMTSNEIIKHADKNDLLRLSGGESLSPEFLLEREQSEKLCSIDSITSSLSDREGLIIKMRFEDGSTYRHIGNAIGVSLERVRQIEFRAIRKMRKDSSKNKPEWSDRRL